MQTPIQKPQLIPYQTLRQLIGWLGILLPAALLAGNFFIRHCTAVQGSISHYYYTITGQWLVGILFAVAMFLISYNGYTRADNIATSVAGFAAVLIAVFPTNMQHLVPQPMQADACLLFTLPEHNLRNAVHYAGAAIFFLTLAFNAIFLFTKSSGPKTSEKKTRNKLFIACGIIMLLALVLIALYGFFGTRFSALEKAHPVFWLEWLALAAFGLSWLVKGQLILKDEQPAAL